MKIAIISSGFLPVTDGVTISIWYRLRYLSQLGHQVILFCPDYSNLANLYPNWQDYTGEILPNIRVINLPSEPFFNLEFERNVTVNAYQIVLKELALFQPDIIHIDEPERLWLGFLRRPGLDFARQHKIPCVAFFHTNFIEYLEDYLPLPKLIIKLLQLVMTYHRNWIYNGYDLTLTSSKSTAKKITKLGFKKVLDAQLLGVESNQYLGETKQDNYYINGIEDKIKIVFLGRLTPDKGWQFILNSLPKLIQEINCNNLAFIVVGEGNLKEEIQEKFAELIPYSYFLGRISPEKIPGLLINSDVYITASEKETRGLTILEALAAGIPVIAPNSGGIIDSIQDGQNGLLFTPKNTDDFIAKLKQALNDKTWRQEIRLNRKNFLEDYQWEKCVDNLLKIWQDLT